MIANVYNFHESLSTIINNKIMQLNCVFNPLPEVSVLNDISACTVVAVYCTAGCTGHGFGCTSSLISSLCGSAGLEEGSGSSVFI